MTSLPTSPLIASPAAAQATPSQAPTVSRSAPARGPAFFQQALERRLDEPRAETCALNDSANASTGGETDATRNDEGPATPGVHGKGRGKPRSRPDTAPDADACALAAQLPLLEPRTGGGGGERGSDKGDGDAGADLLKGEGAVAAADLDLLHTASAQAWPEEVASGATEAAGLAANLPAIKVTPVASDAVDGDPAAFASLTSASRLFLESATGPGEVTARMKASGPSNGSASQATHRFTGINGLAQASRTATRAEGEDLARHADDSRAAARNASTDFSAVDAASDTASDPGLGRAGADIPPLHTAASASGPPGFALPAFAPQTNSLMPATPADGTLPTYTATLQPDVGTRAWEQALGQQLVHMHHLKQASADLQLHPAGLGPLQVHLQMQGDQVHALFLAQPPALRAAVEAALPQLREALAQQGLALGQAQVGTDGGSGGTPHQPRPGRDAAPGPWLRSPSSPLSVSTTPAKQAAVSPGRLHTWA